MTETLYVKRGRRYVPHLLTWDYRDRQRVGTWRMTYAYSEGGRRYEYDVLPDTASFVAAAMLAQAAMERAIADASIAKPSASVPYTKRQLAILNEFRSAMMKAGGLLPDWWQFTSASEVAQAGIDAVRNWEDK